MPKPFDDLFDEALACWPSILTFRVSRLRKNDFILDGLTAIHETMESHHEGDPDEALFNSLQWAIATAVHGAARGWPDRIFRIAAPDIRRDVVRERFEDSLRSALSSDDGSWPDADLAVIRAYFETEGQASA